MQIESLEFFFIFLFVCFDLGDINAHMGYLSDDEVLFLYKLQQGQCSTSFGVNVGKLAELPETILHRAEDISVCFETLRQRAAEVQQQQVMFFRV